MAHTNRFLRTASSLLVATLAATLPAAAQWEARGAPEPIVRGMTLFNNNPVAGSDTLYAGTNGAGFFKVTVSGTGASWVQANNGLPSLRLQNIAVAGTNTVYVAPDSHGVYRTTDGGANWSARNGSGATALGCRNIRGLNLFGSTLYAGTSCTSGGGVFRTNDGGATWSRLGGVTLPEDIRVQSIVVSGFAIMVNTNGAGIYRSTDDGATFAPSNGGITTANPTVYHMIFSTTPGVALAFVEGDGIYKSTDSGATWAPSNSGLPTGAVVLSGFSRASVANGIFVGLDKHGVYRTTDDGATWSLWADPATDPDLGAVRGVLAGGTNGRIYLNTLAGISVVDTNGNAMVKPSGLFMGHGRANHILHAAADRRTVLLATDTVRRIANLESQGYSAATRSDTGITGNTVEGTLVQVRSNPSTLYVSTNSRGVFKSVDGGANWNAVNTGLPSLAGQFPKLAIDPANGSNLLVGMANLKGTGIYRSTDGGANWQAANTGLTTTASRIVNYVVFAQGGTAFAATDGGVYRSLDGGATWALSFTALDAAGQALPTINVQVKPGVAGEVWLANIHFNPDGTLPSSSGAWKSINNGDNWTQVYAGQNVDRVNVSAAGPVLIGVGAVVGQPAVYRSRDGGVTWSPFSTGLVGSDIRTFGSAPDGSRALSLSLEDGLYVAKRMPTIDFSGDGKSDILWRHTDGRQAIWLMNGTAPSAMQEIIGAGTGWSVVLAADMNGDGKSDLVWQHTDGRIAIYLMNGTLPSSTQQILNAGGGWSATHAPDLDGDGNADLVFQNTDGSVAAWTMNGTTMTNGITLIGPGTGWSVIHVADMDGDGLDDLVWRHTDGRHAIWLMNGLVPKATQQILNAGGWTVMHAADLNGDGKADLIFQNADGTLAAWLMDGATMVDSRQLLGAGSGWAITRTGDLNGDGKADLLFLHGDGRVSAWLMNGLVETQTAQLLNAATGWTPRALHDMDGDGKADIVWQNLDGRGAIWTMDGVTMSGGSEIIGPATGWRIAGTEGTNPGASDCPALPANVVMLPDMPASPGVPMIVMLPVGVTGASKLPRIPGPRTTASIASGETPQAYTPNPATITMSFSKCPGDFSYHTQQVDPSWGDVCYRFATNLNYNELTWRTSAVIPYACFAPEADGPWYVNVKYNHNGCAFGATECGTALQWGNGPF